MPPQLGENVSVVGSQLSHATVLLLVRKRKVSLWALSEPAKCHGIQMCRPYILLNTL